MRVSWALNYLSSNRRALLIPEFSDPPATELIAKGALP